MPLKLAIEPVASPTLLYMPPSRTSRFDPLHQWLGIPPTEQPPDYYRLLGLAKFEADSDVIASAADRQMTHVKAFASGPYAAQSQLLLNSLSRARLCLLNPEFKSTYDAKLRERLQEQEHQTAAQTVTVPDRTTNPWGSSSQTPVGNPSHSSRQADKQEEHPILVGIPGPADELISRYRKRRLSFAWKLALVTLGTCGLMSAGLLYYGYLNRPEDSSRFADEHGTSSGSQEQRPSSLPPSELRSYGAERLSEKKRKQEERDTHPDVAIEIPNQVADVDRSSASDSDDASVSQNGTPVQSAEPSTLEERIAEQSRDVEGFQDDEVPDNTVDLDSAEVIRILEEDPSPARRRKAALALGRPTKELDEVVPALVKAIRRDAAPEVRLAAIEALGQIGDLEKHEPSVAAMLAQTVFNTDSTALRIACVRSLISVAPESSHVRRLLRRALYGNDHQKYPTCIALSDSDVIRENRLWACKQLQKVNTDNSWAVSVLIDILEAEIESRWFRYQGSSSYTEYIDDLLDALMSIGKHDPRVYAHFKRYTNVVLARFSDRDHRALLVEYDTRLKTLQAEED